MPMISIKPNGFTTYTSFNHTNEPLNKSKNWSPPPVMTDTKGIISFKANKSIKLAIDWLLTITKEKVLVRKNKEVKYNFKLNFITLTLSSPQVHSDQFIKKNMLNQFLIELNQKYKCENYLWRAESQKSGRIHFHIVSDVFVPWEEMRNNWNRIQNKYGYIDRYTAKTGKQNPNSTDVHSIKNIKDLPAYLAKYCNKNSNGEKVLSFRNKKRLEAARLLRPVNLFDIKPILPDKRKYPDYQCDDAPEMEEKNFTAYRPINGRLWNLSQKLSKLKSATTEISDKIQAEINWLFTKKNEKVKEFEYATVFDFSVNMLKSFKCNAIVNVLREYYVNILVPKPKPDKDEWYKPFVPANLEKVYKEWELFTA